MFPEAQAGLHGNTAARHTDLGRIPGSLKIAGKAAGKGHLPELLRRLLGLTAALRGERIVRLAVEGPADIAHGLSVAHQIEKHKNLL